MNIAAIAVWLIGSIVPHRLGTIWGLSLRRVFLIGIMLFSTTFCFGDDKTLSPQASSSRENSISKSADNKSMRIVRVGYYQFDGFHMYDNLGKRSGYAYDYLQKLRDYTNWKYEYSDPRYEWPRMLELLGTGKVDIVPGVAKTKEREATFSFSDKPICQVSTILTVKAGNKRYFKGNYANWNGIRVGMLKNSVQNDAFIQFAQEKDFSFQPVYFDRISYLTKALQQGKEIDAIVTTSLRAIKGDEWICAEFSPSYMYIAVRKNDHALLKELNSGMQQLETFFPDLQKQLRKIYYNYEKSGILPFSPQEAAYIDATQKSGKVFSVILNPDRKPFSWWENNEYHGIFKEYVHEASRRTGLTFKFVPVRTRQEYYEKRFSPEIDIVFDMVMDFRFAEDNRMKLSQPYFSASVSRLRRRQSNNIAKTVTLLENDYQQKRIRDIFPVSTKIRTCNRLADLVNEVKSGKSDAGYLYTRCAENAICEDTSDQLVAEFVPALETDIVLGVREDIDPLLLKVLNHVISSLDDTFANKVRAKFAPEFKRISSLSVFIHRNPFWAIGIPVVVLLLVCTFLSYLLVVRNRHRKELQRSITKWTVAANIGKLHPFQMHIKTRQVFDDIEQFKLVWPVDNGFAAEIRDWVYSEDCPEIEKAHNDFAQGLSDHFLVTYRVIKAGVTRYFVCYAVRDTDDPEIMIGIIHDVTDTKETELQRDAIQQLWKNVVDNSPVMMFVKSENDDFRYLQCNRDFAAFVGRTPEEVVGHTDAELFNRPQDTLAFRERDQEIMKSDQPLKFQESVENIDGELRHIQTVKMSLKDANGQGLLIGMCMDVTELQNSRDEAQKHEEIFRLTIQSIGDGVLITDENGVVQMINPIAEQLIGLSAQQAKDKPHEEIFRIVSALDDRPVVSPLKRALQAGEIVELGNHTDLLSFDGNRYHIADCAGPIRNRNNEIIGAVLIFRDVTVEYRQREELRASITLWNAAAGITRLAPFRMHIPTRKVYGDIERLNQYWPVVDGKAITPKAWIYPDDLEQADMHFEKFITGETDAFHITFRAIRDGQIRYYRRYGVRDTKDPDMLIGIIQDITQDKELEHDRDAFHALWEQVVDAMPILMFVKSADNDFRYIQCNQNFANFVGRAKSDIIGHTDMEFFPRVREKEHFRTWDSKIMEEGKVQEFYEEAQGADKYYYFQTVKMPFTDAKGNHLLIGLAVDISAHKKAEEERNAAQKLLNNAFNAMPVILYIKSVDQGFRYIKCNENFCKLLGKTENEILGRTDRDIFPCQEEIGTFHDSDLKAVECGEPIEIIERVTGADKKVYHFRTVKTSSTDAQGKTILIGIAVDITELIEQREQMQASQIQLRAGCLMSRSFTYELADDGSITSTNGLFTQMIPHVNNKPLDPEEWVLPEDYQESHNMLISFLNKEIDEVTLTFRTDWFGKRRYYKSIITREANGIFGVTSDVTELVETAEEVVANSLMWKQVMDELPVRFFVKDADDDCRYIMCNKTNADFFGLSAEEIIGKTTEEFCKPSQALTEYLAAEKRILVDHKVNRSRVSFADAFGVIHEMEKIEMPITGVKNRSLLVSIAFDITEREQSLRLAEITSRILAGVVAEPDFRKVLKYIGETTTEVLNCRRVIFAKCDDAGRLHFFLDTGIDPNYQFNQQAVSLHEYYWNCYLDRLNRNELVMFERLGDTPGIEPLFEGYPEIRNMALVGTPVVVDGKLHGVMIITFNDPHVFTDNDIRTLRAIGDCIMLAENRSQQNEALLVAQQEQAYQLAERTALNECLAIFMSSDYLQIPFEKILETIRKHLGASHCYVLQTDAETGMAAGLAEANIGENHKILMGLPPLAFDPNSLWFTELKEKRIVQVPDMTTEDARARLDDSWQPIIEEHQIRSLWVAAIETNDKIWGTLGVVYDDHSPRQFMAKDESFIRSAVRVVSMILARAQHRNDLILALETQLNTAECLRHMVGEEDAKAAMQHLLDIIRKHTHADVVFMVELNEDTASARSWGELTMDSSFSEHDSHEVSFGTNEEWYVRFKQDRPMYIPDTSKVAADGMLGSWAFLLHQDREMRSYYEIPILCDNQLWGSVGIMFTEVTPLSQNCADFMMNAKKFFEILLVRQESRRKLSEAVQLAQTAEKAKSFFLASMSHEIRTPLNAVIGFTEMMKDTEITDPTQLEYIENISVASNALLQLINDILDLSKLEAGQMQLVTEHIDFPKYCEEICRTFQYSAKQKNLQLVVKVPENMPPLMLDQIRMRQIFFNLIGNAIKFTPPGGTVTVSASFSQLTVSSGSLLLKFSDTGIGMPEADQKKIFEPFVQLSKMRGTNASTTGTGLGLPIIRRLIDKMGGTLTVESTEGVGTTFFILLPNVDMAGKGHIPQTTDAASNDSQEAALRAIVVPSDQLHVLVVDDVPINIKIFTVMLKRLGVTFDTASSGPEALEKLKDNHFNWVLTDMYMDGMSGVELAQIIRKNRAYMSVRLAVVSADVDALNYDKKLFDAVLSKPIDRQQLYQCLFGGEK